MSDSDILEAAARALFASEMPGSDWRVFPGLHDKFRARARAVTPLIRAAVLEETAKVMMEATESLEGFLNINERQFNSLPPAPDSKAWQFAKKRLETGRDICARLRGLKEQP